MTKPEQMSEGPVDTTIGYQVGPDTVVTIRAAVFDEDGDPVELPGLEHEQSFVFGYGEVIPGLERGLDGCVVGDRRRIVLSPREAFGRRDPARVVDFERSEFPAETQPGDHFEAENDDGDVIVLSVLEVDAERVVVDMNHPLADQSVTYELEVLAVRPASDEEIQDVTERLLGGATDAIVPLSALLRPRSER